MKLNVHYNSMCFSEFPKLRYNNPVVAGFTLDKNEKVSLERRSCQLKIDFEYKKENKMLIRFLLERNHLVIIAYYKSI